MPIPVVPSPANAGGGGGGDDRTGSATLTAGLLTAGAGQHAKADGTAGMTVGLNGSAPGQRVVVGDAKMTLGLALEAAGTPFTENFVFTLRRPEVVYVGDIAGDTAMAFSELVALEVDERLQESEYLRMTVPADLAKTDYLAQDVDVTYDGRLYRIKVREDYGDGATATVFVEAEAHWMALADRRKVGNFSLIGKTLDEGVTSILDGTDWTVTATPADATTRSIDTADLSVLDLLRRWVRIFGYELDFDPLVHQVAVVATQGTSNGLGFRYGRNLRSIKRREEAPAVTTLVAVGRQGLTSSVEDFGFYTDQGVTLADARARFTREEVWVDESFVEQDSLTKAAVARLAERSGAKVTYDMAVSDLSALTGLPESSYGIGDTVRVADPRFTIDLRTRIARLVRRPLQPWRNEVELQYNPNNYTGDGSRVPSTFTSSWVLLRDESVVARIVRPSAYSYLNELFISFIDNGEAAGAARVYGVGSGTGTLELVLWDPDAAAAFGPTVYVDFTSGLDFVAAVPFSRKELPASNVHLTVRAKVTTGSGTVSVGSGAAELWVLVQGGVGITNPNLFRIEYTGACQTITVPAGARYADVVLDGAGAWSINDYSYPGSFGARVQATLPATPGDVWDVCSGQAGDVAQDIFNGGGNGGTANLGPAAFGGGGMTSISLLGAYLAIAGGAGGGFAGVPGGNAGYPAGTAGTQPSGSGGSQSAGGSGYQNGSAYQGGGGATATGFNTPGGGGGGGRYGGGSGSNGGYTGAGGSSWTDPSATDVIHSLAPNEGAPGFAYILFRS
jgi:hypothetical protein